MAPTIKKVVIAASADCNLRCTICLVHANQKTRAAHSIGMMTKKTWKRIIDEVAHIPDISIVPYNWGEPFFHDDFFEMLAYAVDAGIDSRHLSFSTNGTLVNKETADKIIDFSPGAVVFSIDGLKDSYRRIRGGKSYEQVEKNFHRLVEQRNRRQQLYPALHVRMVVTPSNEHDKSAFVKKWLDVADVVELSELLNDDVRFCLNRTAPEKREPCAALSHYTVIDWNGDVWPCCGITQDHFHLGSIKNSSLESIWNSDKYNRLRSAHQKGDLSDYPICVDCEYFNNNNILHDKTDDQNVRNWVTKYISFFSRTTNPFCYSADHPARPQVTKDWMSAMKLRYES